jgi:hypothetical protein
VIDRTAAIETTRVVRVSTVVCLATAALCMLGGLALGHPVQGALVGLGVLIGAANAHLAQWLLRTAVPMATTSLARIGVLTVVVLLVGLAVGLGRAFLLLFGVAAAQLVMAVSAVVEMTRR